MTSASSASFMAPGSHPVALKLADPAHRLPVPGTKRFFSAAPTGETVDLGNPFWALLVRDGSLVPADAASPPPSATAPAPASAPAPVPAPTALEAAEATAAALRQS